MIDKKHIGRSWPARYVDVEKGRLRMFAQAIGETDPVYVDEEVAKAAGYRSLPAPPTFAFTLDLTSEGSRPEIWEILEALGVDIARVLHGEQRFTYHEPICAGDRLTLESRISDIYDKKDGALEFVVRDTAATNQDGELAVEMRAVVVVRH